MAKASQQQTQEYQQAVRRILPPKPIARNALMAFLVGGTICTAGQVVLNLLKNAGLPATEATAWTAAVFILIGLLLTGMGVYDDLGRIGGMGAFLPITGFANSIGSAAMEFKREGWVLGLGARIFQIAGPVIVYGIAAATVVAGLATWLGGARATLGAP
ncbi:MULTISPECIES: SpoVA/SpoVAEb family sporulation membrane protein [Thermaerobacter]|uniref:SpoVA/SpoVAEb family sporulation membrane protein n=1 Tax=Thermaerobacter composti TaxID=554949 RepID=A0ABZ0QRK0_9FIRM|nr:MULTISPECIES: SpoVA/SpoVAEb family sporulation membrane protein [Thermaerobacter]QBS37946.1 SpoVA/SpoVAEb family sporulation membrane protein [Thermaerobacter sp. FW80]WPD20113.1 SpoVA/SpoVAEb family sporulation membrane protein [Thermaerobacter composti]